MSVKRTATMRSTCSMNPNDIGLKEKKLAQDNIKPQAKNSLDETQSSSLSGGRLQFFKDGKFILELARSKAGTKFGWVSVPKKVLNSTMNTTIHSKNEICASVSDDNSSIQSSPWQRDHIWRKSTPRKDISQEMCMIYKRCKENSTSIDLKVVRTKRRRPYDNINPVICNGNISSIYDQKEITRNTEKDIRPPLYNVIRSKPKLSAIIQKLIDKIPTGLELSKNAVITSNISNFNTTGLRLIDGKYQSNISPRKRILRELEKVTLDDSTKRSRSRNDKILVPNNIQSNLQNLSKNYNPTDNVERNKHLPQHSIKEPTDKYCTISSSTKLCSSYSIHSLLGNICNSSDNKEPARRSPDSVCNQMIKPDDNYIFNTSSKMPLKYTLQDNEVERTTESSDMQCNNNSAICRSDEIAESKIGTSVIINDIEKSSKILNDAINIHKQQGLKKKHNKEYVCTFLQNYPPTKFKKDGDAASTAKTFPYSDIPKYESSSDLLLTQNEKLSNTIPAKNSFLTTYPLLANTFSNATHITNIKNSEICPEQSIAGQKTGPIVHNSSRSNKCNSVSMPALSYMYPENIPLSICHNGSPRFIPSGTYFHPYAIAALRNPLWTHQNTISLPAPIARLPSVFSFNTINTPMNSIDMSTVNSKMRLDSKKDSEICVEEECNSDIPLNLSKH